MNFNPFELMKKALIALLAVASSIVASAAAPKYIFYFIGDGMGPGAVMATDNYLRLVQGRTTPLLWETFPSASLCTTYSASSPVTDSAAAGTALATGVKTRNNMLGMGPDSVAVRPITDDLHAAGYGIGIVTNVAADDATPGAFYAHVPSRNDAFEIDSMFATSPVSFLAGSRIRGIKKDNAYSGIYELLAKHNVKVIKGSQNLTDYKAPRVLLLNDTDTLSNNMGYSIDRPADWNGLHSFTQHAINHLTTHSPKKFFLMVEGGNIDWAAHDNDASTIVREILNYEKTLQLAYEFYLRHPKETLIVVTADHETGGMTVGQRSVGYNFYPALFDHQKISKANFNELLKRLRQEKTEVSWDEVKTLLRDYTGLYGPINVNDRDDQRLHSAYEAVFVNQQDKEVKNLYHSFSQLLDIAFDLVARAQGAGFTTGNHSGNPVGVYAIGAGSELFNRSLDNTDIPKIMRSLLPASASKSKH